MEFSRPNTGVGSLSLLQGIFPTQGSNPGVPHCRWILYQLSHQGIPSILEWVAYPFFSGSSRPRNQTGVFCIAGRFFTGWATREAQEHWSRSPISSRSSQPRNQTGGNFYIQNWINNKVLLYSISFPGSAVVENLPANTGDSRDSRSENPL